MTKRRLSAAFATFAALVLLAAAAIAQDVERITKEDLKARLGGKEAPVVLDVRTGSDWKGSDAKIPGSVRPDMDKGVQQWAKDLQRDKAYVLYCA